MKYWDFPVWDALELNNCGWSVVCKNSIGVLNRNDVSNAFDVSRNQYSAQCLQDKKVRSDGKRYTLHCVISPLPFIYRLIWENLHTPTTTLVICKFSIIYGTILIFCLTTPANCNQSLKNNRLDGVHGFARLYQTFLLGPSSWIDSAIIFLKVRI